MRNFTPRAILINLVVGATVFLGAQELRFPSLIPCTNALFQNVIWACAVVLTMDLALLPKIVPVRLGWVFFILGIFCAVAAWLGSYQISPLGFGRGGLPLVSGFRITRSERQPIVASLGQVIVIAADSTLAIEPTTLPGTSVSCRWRSTNGGAIDDPASCDVAYQPPTGVTYDVLSVLAQPDCGLPDHVTEIRFSIAP